MAINIAAFVPAGIIIGSDNLAFQRSEDDGAMYEEATSTFALHNRFILSFIGDGFVGDWPYDYYIETIALKSQHLDFPDVNSFDAWLMSFWKEEGCNIPSYYLAGYNINGSDAIPVVLLCENGHSSVVNSDGEKPVYYFHSCGRNQWIDKILLDTSFTDPQTEERIDMQPALINYSKFGIKMAVSFISFMLETSAKLDSFCAIKNNVGNTHTIIVATPTGTYEV